MQCAFLCVLLCRMVGVQGVRLMCRVLEESV